MKINLLTKENLLIPVLLLTLLLPACRKNELPPTDKLEVVETEMTVGKTDLAINGSVDYPGKIFKVRLLVGTDTLDMGRYKTELNDKDFSVTVNRLTPNTAYYYRYAIDLGMTEEYCTPVQSFKTKDEGFATVKTNAVTDISYTSAKCGGDVTNEGLGGVTERGICISHRENPTTADSCYSGGSGLGNYSIQLEGLKPNTTYHIRAYALNEVGAAYGEDVPFTTKAIEDSEAPVVATQKVTAIGINTATFNGEVLFGGAASVSSRGLCWGITHDPVPTIGNYVSCGTGAGTFDATVTGLTSNTIYYVRAYATNSYGTGFGEEVSFITQSEIRTDTVTDITQTSARCIGYIPEDNGAEITQRGVCWSTHYNPTINNDEHVESGSGTGGFSAIITGLSANTKYHVRAYSVSGRGLTYGNDVSFHTRANLAKVTTRLKGYWLTSGRIEGDVVVDDGSEVTERGVCWATSSHPTLDDDYLANGSGTGSYEVNIEDLEQNTTYYACAYAINREGLSYGNVVSFTTFVLPTVATSDAVVLSDVSASIGGQVVAEGSHSITERGVYWNTSSYVYNGNKVVCGSGTGEFSTEITGLAPNTHYYFCAYAKSEVGMKLGEVKSFYTFAPPIVQTLEVTDITAKSATGNGTVVDNHGGEITECGICWSSSNSVPTLEDNHGSGTGTQFSVEMKNLLKDTHYYVRSYAINQYGVGYGNVVGFHTKTGIPTIQTMVANITINSAVGQGSIINTGGADVLECGVCWSTHSVPTINDYHATGSGNPFSVTMTGLSHNTRYYVRAYVINEYDTYYGNEKTFITVPTGVISGAFSVSQNSAVRFSQGNLQYIGNAGTPYWKFAEHQWEYLGSTTGQNSTSQFVERDLFGYGTSGYYNGQACYQPFSTSQVGSDYYSSNLVSSSDWGYNRINNGGDMVNAGWRTLTRSEWDYVFNTRNTTSGIRYAKAQITGVANGPISGVILLPDDWSESYYPLYNTNQSSASFNSNVISLNAWVDSLESYGAVFLPTAGSRNGTSVGGVGYGYYWSSSSSSSSSNAYRLFIGSELNTNSITAPSYGYSVRLVYPIR